MAGGRRERLIVEMCIGVGSAAVVQNGQDHVAGAVICKGAAVELKVVPAVGGGGAVQRSLIDQD